MSETVKQPQSEKQIAFERLCKLLTRIKSNSMMAGDFAEFVEYLNELEEENYQDWLVDAQVRDGIHKGYGKAISELKKAFVDCDSGRYVPIVSPQEPESQN